jgi:D-arabinose 1-dehydrogenase-like Zn-dependent alcohol dehydrogenase
MGTTAQTEADVKSSLAAAAQGKLKATINTILPLSEARRAHELMSRRDTLGKILLCPTGDTSAAKP